MSHQCSHSMRQCRICRRRKKKREKEERSGKEAMPHGRTSKTVPFLTLLPKRPAHAPVGTTALRRLLLEPKTLAPSPLVSNGGRWPMPTPFATATRRRGRQHHYWRAVQAFSNLILGFLQQQWQWLVAVMFKVLPHWLFGLLLPPPPAGPHAHRRVNDELLTTAEITALLLLLAAAAVAETIIIIIIITTTPTAVVANVVRSEGAGASGAPLVSTLPSGEGDHRLPFPMMMKTIPTLVAFLRSLLLLLLRMTQRPLASPPPFPLLNSRRIAWERMEGEEEDTCVAVKKKTLSVRTACDTHKVSGRGGGRREGDPPPRRQSTCLPSPQCWRRRWRARRKGTI